VLKADDLSLTYCCQTGAMITHSVRSRLWSGFHTQHWH